MARYIPPPIKSDALIDWFRECGFPVENASRIVIDAQTGEVLKVYVEMFGTTAMLDMKPPDFSRAQITIVGKKPGEDE